MRTEIKSLVEKIKDYELKYNSDKSKETKKELQFLIDELYREIEDDRENAEQNTYILENIFPIITKIFDGFGIGAMLLEPPRMKVSKSIWSILLEKNLIKRTNVKALDYSINPRDKDLSKIFNKIVGDDEFRPVMNGISFQGDIVVGTDAHKLIQLKGKRLGNFKDGVYKLYSEVEKKYLKSGLDASMSFDEYYKSSVGAEIEGIYPNYINVVPKYYQYTKQFDLNFLNDICKTIYKNYLVNTTTRQMVLEFNTEDGIYRIGFNSSFLSDVCESLLMAGENIVNFYFNQPNKAVVILGENKTFPEYKLVDKFFRENTFCIIMPVMLWNDDNEKTSENLKYNPLIKYNNMYDFDITIGDSPTYNFVSSHVKKVETKKPKSDIYKDLIEGYELALEMETNTKKIKLFQDIIEGYKLALELA